VRAEDGDRRGVVRNFTTHGSILVENCQCICWVSFEWSRKTLKGLQVTGLKVGVQGMGLGAGERKILRKVGATKRWRKSQNLHAPTRSGHAAPGETTISERFQSDQWRKRLNMGQGYSRLHLFVCYRFQGETESWRGTTEMIPEHRVRELMLEAISEAGKSAPEDHGIHPRVGAVLADANGNTLDRANRGELGRGDHAEYLLLQKAKEKGWALNDASIFVTLEPCTARGPGKVPCTQRILDSGISTVYIGMLDPNPQICGRGETLLRYSITVERFPGELVKQIEALNMPFIDLHRSAHLPQSSLYVTQQISDLISDYLNRQGLYIGELPFDWDVTVEDLERYCTSALDPKNPVNLHDLLSKARGHAFDAKYADYTYDKDVRGLDDSWQHELRELLRLLRADDYPKRRLVDVGIGNGLEVKGIFDKAVHLTAVDIAPKSLERAKARVPSMRCILEDAEDLKTIQSASQDLYISLRTFQSSYFGITRALQEAYRIVRQGGIVLISVANGFLGEDSALIPGLVIPRSSVVNRDRPFEVAEKIRRKLTLMRFEEVGVRTGLAEIYVYGRRGR
jgi:pyrimidine deaminase RibD-like protein/SAM-dependent methyltransferase